MSQSPSHLLAGRAMIAQLAVVLTIVLAYAALPATAQAQVAPPDSMLPLQIDEVVVRDGQLVAIGSLGNTTFETPLNLTLDQIINDPNSDVCAILDLEVGAINLNLLGLRVETSDICLLIAAEPGDGNLLGNLLCGIAGLLDDGLSLEDILAGLDPADLQDLLDQIRDLLNGALGDITSPASIAGVSDSGERRGQGQGQGPPPGRGQGRGQPRECDILNLSLGPVALDLLGLQVFLDDCDGGPVTVDVIAEQGRGNLLGNLLCSLAGLLDDPNADLNRLNRLLNRIVDAILRLT